MADAAKVSVLIDLDPSSAAQTVIVESLAADPRGMLYVCDRVSGNVWRIDPRNPKLVVVGRVQERDIGGKKVRADVSGIVFNQAGDLYLTAGGFKEVLRIRGRSLDSAKSPGRANLRHRDRRRQRHRLRQERQSLCHRRAGTGESIAPEPEGGQAPRFSRRSRRTRANLPDGKTEQALTANGIVFDKQGTTLYIADTARGAIWKLAIGTDGQSRPTGADDTERSYSKALTARPSIRRAISGSPPTNATRSSLSSRTARVFDVQKNDSKGPLEFPTAVVFVEATAYVSNFDTARRDNLAADGKTSIDGIGASIVKIEP